MFSKDNLLKYAFQEAITAVNINSVDSEIAKAAVATGMNAYADREGFEFSSREVKETIENGFKTLSCARVDFEM